MIVVGDDGQDGVGAEAGGDRAGHVCHVDGRQLPQAGRYGSAANPPSVILQHFTFNQILQPLALLQCQTVLKNIM